MYETFLDLYHFTLKCFKFGFDLKTNDAIIYVNKYLLKINIL